MSVQRYLALKPRRLPVLSDDLANVGQLDTSQLFPPSDNEAQVQQQPITEVSLKTKRTDIIQREGGPHNDTPRVTLDFKMPIIQANNQYEDSSLLVRKILKMDKDRKYQKYKTLAEFRDPYIQRAFQFLLRHFNYVNFASLPIIFQYPYQDLFFVRNELQEYKDSAMRSVEERASLDVLSEFIEEEHKESISDYNQLVPNGFITFKRIWTLFPPNTLIISVVDGLQRAYRVTKSSILKSMDGNSFLQISCWGWSYCDGYFGRFETSLKVPKFDNCQRILALDVYPFHLLPEKAQTGLYDELVRSGKKWRAMISTCHRLYQGAAWEIKMPEEISVDSHEAYGRSDQWKNHKRTPIYVNNRIILNDDAFVQHNPGASIQLVRGDSIYCVGSDVDLAFAGQSIVSQDGMNHSERGIFVKYPAKCDYRISDQHALLCSRTIRGYCLRTKVWADFIVDNVKDIEWDDECFDKLQINQGLKTTLECLVSQYSTTKTGFKDVLKDKSKGLTILLRGPPGSGKTLTAETISERCRKPLINITSGELGTEADVAEERLLKSFVLAQQWNAIVLIDEADVFLSQRTAKDIKRNAFISVFLRTMEWYSGILLLTTNRHEDFDDAFRSRIHISIPYTAADAKTRTAIWKTLLRAQDDIEHELDSQALIRIGEKYELNGRELKNLLSMSLAISKGNRTQLNEATIDSMYKLCNN